MIAALCEMSLNGTLLIKDLAVDSVSYRIVVVNEQIQLEYRGMPVYHYQPTRQKNAGNS